MRLALAEMPDDADAVYAAAEYANANANLEQAVAYLRNLPVDRHTPDSLALRTTSLAGLNRMDPEAEMVYPQYLEENPSDTAVQVTLGNVFIREKRHEKAEHLYQADIKLDPSNMRVWYDLDLTHMKVGCYEEAMGAPQPFMKTDSWDSYRSKEDVHRIMGVCMMQQGMLSQALKQFQMGNRSMQTLDRLYERGNSKGTSCQHVPTTMRYALKMLRTKTLRKRSVPQSLVHPRHGVGVCMQTILLNVLG